MQVKDVLKTKDRDLITIHAEDPILKAMELLLSHKISCLLVIHDDHILDGLISDKDIFREVYQNQTDFKNRKVGEVMTSDLIVGVESDSMDYISGLMTKNRIRHIPIVEEQKLVGLVSIGDVVKSNQKHIEIENRYLRQYIDGQYPG